MLRGKIAEVSIDELAFVFAMERAGDLAKAGQGESRLFLGAEILRHRTEQAPDELLMSAGGADALEWESERSKEGAIARAWLRSKANSIEGGTSEVQLNIVAKRILGLPGA